MTHQIVHEDKTVYNTAQDVFPGLGYWERYLTSGFKDLASIYGATKESYRKTSDVMNRIRYQPDDGTPSRTVREQAEGEGRRLMKAIDHQARQILSTHDFREDGIFEGDPTTYQGHGEVSLSEDRVAKAIAVCQAQVKVHCDLSTNPVGSEDPEQTVNMTIDDVGSKRQKATRTCHRQEAEKVVIAPNSAPNSEQTFEEQSEEKPEKKSEKKSEKKKRTYVHTTVIHVEQARRSYLITGHGIKYVLSVLIAFLLNSHLLQCRLQFFTDGYTILHDAIRWCFSWYPNLAII